MVDGKFPLHKKKGNSYKNGFIWILHMDLKGNILKKDSTLGTGTRSSIYHCVAIPMCFTVFFQRMHGNRSVGIDPYPNLFFLQECKVTYRSDLDNYVQGRSNLFEICNRCP